MATAVPAVDAETTGRYGDGLGSETEERQVELLLEHLREGDDRYRAVDREVPYPDGSERCDLLLPTGTPVEVKLIRYWRANGDPEPTMYTHVFSPFHRNTLLTDAAQLRESAFETPYGLLGLFYARSEDDPEPVESLSERYTAEEIAERVVRDLEYWHDADAKVCGMSRFDGLRHRVHGRGAVVSWLIG
jgi:nucleotide-binding universal stress UspA family protein